MILNDDPTPQKKKESNRSVSKKEICKFGIHRRNNSVEIIKCIFMVDNILNLDYIKFSV